MSKLFTAARSMSLIDYLPSNYDEAIRVMQRATAIPKNPKINYHDHVSRSWISQ